MKKLIMLYGFAASGKTTIAKKYINEHLLAMSIEGDQLIGMMGQWRENEDEARKLVFEYTKSIAEKHLEIGYDVIVPCLLNDARHPDEFKEIADRTNTSFYEVYIDIEKVDAVNRLISRGCWGEEGSRKLTEDDRSELESRFDFMSDVMKKRIDKIFITSKIDDIDNTYQKLKEVIS